MMLIDYLIWGFIAMMFPALVCIVSRTFKGFLPMLAVSICLAIFYGALPVEIIVIPVALIVLELIR